ncbi:MAG: sigma-70 family RNA polymerase sigma factor [Verrucomicrobiota bacterium]|jgi:RNA polymerase sigma-70 factor (ECF subfamily)
MQNSAQQVIDQILVMDAQSGRREAFEMLVSRWQKRLWWHAFNLTGCTEAAWDITQESWLDIVRGLARLKDPAKFGSWAYRIISNKAYDWRCRNGRESSPGIVPEDQPTPAAEQGKHETASDVHDILRRLPTRSQVVLNLYYLEGFDVAEIAGILGAPEGTVKSRLHTARAEFRKHWESLGAVSPALVPASGKEKQHE